MHGILLELQCEQHLLEMEHLIHDDLAMVLWYILQLPFGVKAVLLMLTITLCTIILCNGKHSLIPRPIH